MNLLESILLLKNEFETPLAILEAEIEKMLPKESKRVHHKSACSILTTKGKRMRSLATFMVSKISGSFPNELIQIALAAELTHAATLLHDDVLDFGELRRNQVTARMIYKNTASILGGDFLMIDALQRIQKLHNPQILYNLMNCIQKMVEAECLQFENQGKFDVSLGSYMEVSQGKTGALFQWAMDSAARVCCLPEINLKKINDFAYHMGIAFQLNDDLLDIHSPSSTIGKENFMDLKDGKLTFPFIWAYKLDSNIQNWTEEFIETESSFALEKILKILKETQAKEKTKKLIKEHMDHALKAFSFGLSIPKDDKLWAIENRL